ncbi:MAG TPA: HAMP domain-containing sensor histidine kinase, partial [Gemmataceae bacterium]|nr:HAMP domain-containing sensor histidine kinase [Gemmataceae bacterium]
MPRIQIRTRTPAAVSPEPPPDPVTEIGVLLSGGQLTALLAAADNEATTVGSLIRRILSESLYGGRNRRKRTDRTRVSAARVCPAACRTGGTVCGKAPQPELSSGVWEFLESARSALEEAWDESGVCSVAVRLAVPVFGRGCAITLPGPVSGPGETWRTPGWDAAAEPEADCVLSLAHAGRPAGTLTLWGHAALEACAFRRASRLFAEAVSRALERAAAAETASRDFYSGALAHELGNALAPLVYGAETIRRTGLDFQVGRDAYMRMDRQISHLRSVLEGMLDLRRAASGKLVLMSQDVDLEEIMGHSADTVEALVREKRHRLTVSVATDARRLWADPVRLEHVLVNLLTNAARYTEPGRV